MLISSKIEAIAKRLSPMATIFEFMCYHLHVAWWLRKWPKWAIRSTSAASPGAWHVRKSPGNVQIRWYRYMSGKKVQKKKCAENIGPASTCWVGLWWPPLTCIHSNNLCCGRGTSCFHTYFVQFYIGIFINKWIITRQLCCNTLMSFAFIRSIIAM